MYAYTSTPSRLRLASPRPALAHAMGCQRRLSLVVRASDDEDIVPILTGRRKTGFTDKEKERLQHPHLLGGKTIGAELELLRARYTEAEQRALQEEAKLVSNQW